MRGRGNKAAILAQAVEPGGAVDAADLHPQKLARLERQLAQRGLPLRRTYALDWSVGAGDVPPGYDRALVDAPCSGVGTLRRRPDLALRRDPEDLGRLAALQAAIVRAVATRVRPGGRLVYAVCSVLREEGEEVVAAVLASDAGLESGAVRRRGGAGLVRGRADPTLAPPCARHRRLLPRELRAPRLAGW